MSVIVESLFFPAVSNRVVVNDVSFVFGVNIKQVFHHWTTTAVVAIDAVAIVVVDKLITRRKFSSGGYNGSGK